MVGHAKYIDALTAERDRLAAENAELRLNSQMLPSLHREVSELDDKLSAANATLARLREVVNQNEWDRAQNGDLLDQFRAILNPENET